MTDSTFVLPRLKTPLIMTLIHSDRYVLSAQIISTTCALASIALLLFHVVRKHKYDHVHNDKSNVAFSKGKLLAFEINIILVLSLISNALLCLMYMQLITPSGPLSMQCFTFYILYVLLWALNKTFIYYSYFLRLDLSFADSAFAVNRHLLRTLYAGNTLYFIVYVIVLAFVEEPRHYFWNARYQYCERTPNIHSGTLLVVLSALIIVYDSCMSVVTLLLFLKPLWHLKKIQNDEKLHHLIVKVSLLNSLLIMSSLLAFMLYAVTVAGVFILLDNVVNAVSFVLMAKVHHKLYLSLCRVCISGAYCKYTETEIDHELEYRRMEDDKLGNALL